MDGSHLRNREIVFAASRNSDRNPRPHNSIVCASSMHMNDINPFSNNEFITENHFYFFVRDLGEQKSKIVVLLTSVSHIPISRSRSLAMYSSLCSSK